MMNNEPPRCSPLELEELTDRRIGRGIARMRRRAGLSVEDLAIRSGLPAEELRDHERGLLPIPLSRVPILCRTLGIPMGTLIRAMKRADRQHRRALSGTASPRY
jgi:transcriptional regulator with XRE-family HTH domain